jgi:hypothetical protein
MIHVFIALSAELKLLEREAPLSTILLPIVIISFFLVGWSGMRTAGFLIILIKNFLRISPKESEFKESLKITIGATILLFFNFFISLTTCFFLLLNDHLSILQASGFAILTSVVFIFIQQFGYRFVSFLSGETDVLDNISTINRNTWQLGGILLLVIATTWTLNLHHYKIMSYCFLIILFLLLIFRIVKGLSLTFKKRIKWYYFILYLCALEILPAFVFIRLALDVFQWKM